MVAALLIVDLLFDTSAAALTSWFLASNPKHQYRRAANNTNNKDCVCKQAHMRTQNDFKCVRGGELTRTTIEYINCIVDRKVILGLEKALVLRHQIVPMQNGKMCLVGLGLGRVWVQVGQMSRRNLLH